MLGTVFIITVFLKVKKHNLFTVISNIKPLINILSIQPFFIILIKNFLSFVTFNQIGVLTLKIHS